jgi:cobalt-zinc-cadmium efflux system protein
MSAHGRPAERAGARHQRTLARVLVMVMLFMAVEVAAGLATRSLALLSDAGHMLTDGVGLGMALAAIATGSRADIGGQRTYGLYRLEILAALANAVLLFGVAVYVLVEAVSRLREPQDVIAGPMLAVALAGLVVNVVGWRLLRAGAVESLNLEGARLEVLADLAGSLGVVGAALVLIGTGWPYADPVVGAAVGVLILPRAWRLGWKALRILVQAAPPHVDVDRLRCELGGIAGVLDVHDLHVWTLTSEMDVASAHLMVTSSANSHDVLDQARDVLRAQYHIAHATPQVEPDSHEGCAEIAW